MREFLPQAMPAVRQLVRDDVFLAAPDRWAAFILLQNADTAIGFIEVQCSEPVRP